jgi:class 3 adenylate cyclase
MEPDEVFSQLNEFFGAAGEIIGRYRGYINKTNGDGIMALFGVRSRARPTKRMSCSRRWRFSARLARSFRLACASASTRAL